MSLKRPVHDSIICTHVKRALVSLLLRWTLVNRTYGGHKKLYIHLFLLTVFGPIYHRPP